MGSLCSADVAPVGLVLVGLVPVGPVPVGLAPVGPVPASVSQIISSKYPVNHSFPKSDGVLLPTTYFGMAVFQRFHFVFLIFLSQTTWWSSTYLAKKKCVHLQLKPLECFSRALKAQVLKFPTLSLGKIGIIKRLRAPDPLAGESGSAT